jgi:ATP-dependent helicase HrpA
VSARRDEITEAIAQNPVVIVCGETGSGKTTQLPKICLAMGRGRGAGGKGLIGHTQPRRLAASSVARRIADEIGSPLGEHVGFKVRFNDVLSKGASVKLMTDGILLAETQTDPLLLAYDTIIIDEAHERSLNIDFLLGYLKQLLSQRDDLKVIVTSATIDAERFAEYFGQDGKPAPVIEVSGRLYPVEIRYRPVNAAAKSDEAATALIDAVDELARLGQGDILVFLAGEREIRDAAELLRKHHPPHTEILPLFSRLSAAEQQRVFQSGNARRIILATNVAETSLTVPGVRYVVDTGLARIKRYSYRNKVEQLHIESISQASANQRSGRCGRVADGVCIRLYAEDDFLARPAFSDPEILRSSLAGVILRMKSLDLGEISEFSFLEAPSGRAIADGYQLLHELNAVDERNELTKLGGEVARLPLDPRIARMLLAARQADCVEEMLVLAAALSIQDPRDRPLEAQAAADQAHLRFADERSEFSSDLKLWRWYQEQVDNKKSQRQLREVCRDNFISAVRMREWHDVEHQLRLTVSELGWRINPLPATYEQIHIALLTGLLGNVGLKSETESHFLGARGIKFLIWPGSALVKKPGRWVMAAELIETSRLYARTLAKIDPLWLERVGSHLIKTSISDPHWEKGAGRATAMQRGTLYGLTVYQQRRVDFAQFDAALAREMLIRDGLVAGLREDSFEPRNAQTKAMMLHNRRLVADIERLEHKTRRPDVLVDDDLIYAIFDQRIPAEINDQRGFEQWYATGLIDEPRLLYLSRDSLMRHEAAGVTTRAFPKAVEMSGVTLSLDYQFEPGNVRDGVTMTVPLFALNQIDIARTEWLVPGMLADKLQFILKSLPQRLRRSLVPIPAYVEEFMARHEAPPVRQGLVQALIIDLRESKGLSVRDSDFKLEAVPAHLQMNFRVIDTHGRQLGMARNLAGLRAEFGDQAQRQFQEAFAAARSKSDRLPEGSLTSRMLSTHDPQETQPVELSPAALEGGVPRRLADQPVTDWTFEPLPELLELERGSQTLVGYPALVDCRDYCELRVFDDQSEARQVHRLGLRRLFALQLKEPLKFLEKNLSSMTGLAIHFMSIGTMDALKQQIIDVALDRACLVEPLPSDAASFSARVQEGRSRIGLIAQEIARQAESVLQELAAVQKKLVAVRSHASAFADMQSQLKQLVGRDFVRDTPYQYWVHLPRYLRAIGARADKLRADPARDARLAAQMAPLETRWTRTVQARRGQLEPALLDFGWLLQELRVALFAQELRTPMPVSVKRLNKVWDSLQR